MSHGSTVPVYVLGQTPPPFGGQSVMIQAFLDGKYPGFRLIHIPMQFSRSMSQVGKLRLTKVVELGRVIARSLLARRRYGNGILYYPPASPNLVPVLRDTVLLMIIRPFFVHTIFHFHAAGLGDFLARVPMPLRYLCNMVYRNPSIAIQLSTESEPDGTAINARETLVVENGIPDPVPHQQSPVRYVRKGHQPLRLLFVGLMLPGKGIFTLIQALGLLNNQAVPCHLTILGSFPSTQVEADVYKLVDSLGLQDCIDIVGTAVGDAKWKHFASADIFCFPSMIDNQSIAVLEAMAWGLPVVATRHGAISDLVSDPENGYLVAGNSPTDLCNAVRLLNDDAVTRMEMGISSRMKYQECFSVERFHARMYGVLIRCLTATS